MLIGKGNPDDCCWQKADNAVFGSNKFSVSKWRLIFQPEISSFSSFFGLIHKYFPMLKLVDLWSIQCTYVIVQNCFPRIKVSSHLSVWVRWNYEINQFLIGNALLRALCSFCNCKHKIHISCWAILSAFLFLQVTCCQDQFVFYLFIFFFKTKVHHAKREKRWAGEVCAVKFMLLLWWVIQ